MSHIEKSLNEKVIAGYVKEILLGLSHCHAMNVLHRDLRPENVIFADKKCKHLKLIDFKFAKVFNETQKSQEVLGAPAYIAPEVLSKRMYSTKADIWSCGIITYLLLCGNLPYIVTTKMRLSELFGIIQANKFTMESFKGSEWDRISVEGKTFLLKMLEADPENRANAEELLKDPWLSNTNETPINDDTAKSYLTNIRSTLVLRRLNFRQVKSLSTQL
jgi:calcium-dependent protein kinase